MRKSLLIAIIVGSSPALHASDLTVAFQYNTFVFGNINQSNIDAQGKVAAGGNVTYSNFMVGTDLSFTEGLTDLVVGGTLNATNLNVQNGGVAIGSSTGTSVIKDPTIGGYVSTDGNLQVGAYGEIGYAGGNTTGVETGGSFTNNVGGSGTVSIFGLTGNAPIAIGVNFAAAQAALIQQSQYWASLSQTAAPVVNYYGAQDQISVTGTNSSLDVFDLNGSDLASATGLTINAPSGATVLLNINGVADSLSNFQINLVNTDVDHVLYNFYQSTTVNDSNVSIEGTLLAPYAAFTGSGGHIDGTLIASSLSGQFEQHLDLFQGNLQVPSANAPESGTLIEVLAGVCLLGLGGARFAWRKARV
jgi:choice-of-anchor A domain-containing protein